MNSSATPAKVPEAPRGSSRHSILDLAPLELECMSVLWAQREGTVREVHAKLAQSRPRAYTTIMTILDRLTRKGVVTRLKVGRAYRYRPQLSAEEARANAVEKVVAGFFHGSVEALATYLAELQASASPAEPSEHSSAALPSPQPSR